MPYAPGPVPLNPEDIPRYLQEELIRINEDVRQQESIEIEELEAAPDYPQNGQVVYADGTNWDPGSGEGFYFYNGTEWVHMGSKLGTDSVYHDAFGRLRTSGTGQRLDVEFLYDKQPDYFDELTANGSVTFNANARDLTLAIDDTTSGTEAMMISHPVPYTPGNSQLIDITGVLDLANVGGGTAEVFLRSKVTGTVTTETVAQADWDAATAGVSWNYSHILMMDFQSLKVGRARYYLVQGGAPKFLAEITNDNERNTGYWQYASLSAYWHIYNNATETIMEMGYGDPKENAIGIRYRITKDATATMKAICCTVKSEGGPPLYEMPGLPRSVDIGETEKVISATLRPIVSIRPQTTFGGQANKAISLPKGLTVETNNPIRLVVYHNATLGGGNFSAVSNSVMEYDLSASSVTGGSIVYSGYFSSSSKNTATSGQGLLGKTVLWDRQALGSETGIMTVAAIKTGATDGEVLVSINWEEIR